MLCSDLVDHSGSSSRVFGYAGASSDMRAFLRICGTRSVPEVRTAPRLFVADKARKRAIRAKNGTCAVLASLPCTFPRPPAAGGVPLVLAHPLRVRPFAVLLPAGLIRQQSAPVRNVNSSSLLERVKNTPVLGLLFPSRVQLKPCTRSGALRGFRCVLRAFLPCLLRPSSLPRLECPCRFCCRLTFLVGSLRQQSAPDPVDHSGSSSPGLL